MREAKARHGFSDSLAAAFDLSAKQDLALFLADQGIDKDVIAQARLACPNARDLIETLYRNGHLTADRARDLRAGFHACFVVDQKSLPRDPELAKEFPASFCARQGIIPWMQLDGRTVLAAANPEKQVRQWRNRVAFENMPIFAAATEKDVTDAIMQSHGPELAERAVYSVRSHESSLTVMQSAWKLRQFIVWILFTICAGMLLAPKTTFVTLTLLGILVLWASITLKTLAFCAQHFAERRAGGLRALSRPKTQTPPVTPPDSKKPVVSLLVPLHKERRILPRLVSRLSALDWPKHLLDVKLVVEEEDTETLEALAEMSLPNWIHVIAVPDGTPKTKPRAMNIALDFCQGEFVGIYDAEDRPEPDQIARMVETFAKHGPDVACLQGVLDYYNPHQNWLARCFSIEYSAWFRIILPGIERLGLPVPLGGTTVFFRRKALEDLGRWDAFNVTEDADLGIRINRHGLRTAMLRSSTFEEANCFIWPWIRQRSRWLKGYMLTWLVHMQTPKRLHQELGLRRHIGFQCLLVTTNLMFLLAPFLWSFWASLFGWSHPAIELLGENTFFWIMMSFFFAEISHLVVTCTGVAAPERRSLLKWVPTMHFYYILGTFAAFKALIELVTDPFYWDKTAHGHSLDLVDE